MAEYEKPTDRTYKKTEEMKLKFGVRVSGGKSYSMVEVCGYERKGRGPTVGTEVQAHVLVVDGDEDNKARFLGADVGVDVGLDLKSFEKDGHVLGVEVRARSTLTEFNTGPINVHVGAGVSTGAKIEGGTFAAKLAGSGFMVGKRIGGSVFDNEISIDAAALFGKGWLW